MWIENKLLITHTVSYQFASSTYRKCGCAWWFGDVTVNTLMRHVSAASKISWDMGFKFSLFVQASR